MSGHLNKNMLFTHGCAAVPDHMALIPSWSKIVSAPFKWFRVYFCCCFALGFFYPLSALYLTPIRLCVYYRSQKSHLGDYAKYGQLKTFPLVRFLILPMPLITLDYKVIPQHQLLKAAMLSEESHV